MSLPKVDLWRRWLPGPTAVLVLLLLITSCERPLLETQLNAPPASANQSNPTPTLAHTSTPTPVLTPTPLPATATPTATPILQDQASLPACGQVLPLLPPQTPMPETPTTLDETALRRIQQIMPEAALPAWQQIVAAPETVALVAYRLGEEDDGVYLNADVPMPLASVVKVIHLVAYVEAVTAGRLDGNTVVPLETLDRYYLPHFDLGAHAAALEQLEEEGRVLTVPPGVRLEEVPWMMVRYSSNAASDYLHLLLGQRVIEETAVSLGLTTQTAPCPFLGQFLAMANHTRHDSNDWQAIRNYVDEPAEYGREVMLLTDAFVSDAEFRRQEIEWREQRRFGLQRRPSLATQRLFSHNLNVHASARDYAGLMARIAQNDLSNADSSFLARRYLEWPMRFPANQERFSNLGYKNGSLPGILTTVYYAYPRGDTTPVVLALFFRDLPNRTYRQWRTTLPHDELARWLLADAEAIPALRAVFTP